jgi:hypothetical protein
VQLAEEFSTLDNATPAPDSSFVVVADVRRSTDAIQRGQQREVNLVGAACIAAVRNSFPQGLIPYVFGGDGATFLVSEEQLAQLKELLAPVQSMAQDCYRLSLRVGEVSVAELRMAKTDVRVRKMGCGEVENFFFLQGSGLALADKIVKARDEQNQNLLAHANLSANAKIEGLSCRLLPFHSQRGKIYSFIIEPQMAEEEQFSIFKSIFQQLNEGGPIERMRPLQKENSRRAWLPRTWLSEAALHVSSPGLLARMKAIFRSLKENLLTTLVFKYNIHNSTTGLPERYMDELLLQSDWIKLNGSLYLILDMTLSEYEKFESALQLMEGKGMLLYGCQPSKSSLVVCHLHAQSEKSHFHFVDGSDGGLTLAAAQLKQKKINY